VIALRRWNGVLPATLQSGSEFTQFIYAQRNKLVDRSSEFVKMNRLRQQLRGPEPPHGHFQFTTSLPSEDNDGQTACIRVVSQALDEVASVTLGHPHVRNDKIGSAPDRKPKSMHSVKCAQHVYFVLSEAQGDGFGNLRVIVDA
jgi:hypothetical protein